MPRSKSRGESLSTLSGSGGRKWLFPKCSHQMQRWANCRQSTLVTATINRKSNTTTTTTTINHTNTTTTNGIPVPNQKCYPKNETTATATVTDNNTFTKRTCSIMRLTSGRNHCNSTSTNTDANTINTKKYNRRSTAF